LYLYSTAICQEMEMMGRLLVTKAHSLVAPYIHARKMVLWTGTGRLAFCADAEKAQNKASEGNERSTTHSFRHCFTGTETQQCSQARRLTCTTGLRTYGELKGAPVNLSFSR
jgi:hypothetical protein